MAVLADEKAVLSLIDELFAPPGARPPDYSCERASEGVHRYVGDEYGDILLAVDGEEVIGIACVFVDLRSIRSGLRCWLEDLVVTSTRRSEGIGRLLLDAATAWAAERGCTHLELDSGNGRKDAHRFYVANGMTQDGLVFGKAVR